jgi:hypothetical protein
MLGGSAEVLFAELPREVAVSRSAPAAVLPLAGVAPAVRDDDESVVEIVARTRQLTASNADDRTIAFLGSSLEGIVTRYDREGPNPSGNKRAHSGS